MKNFSYTLVKDGLSKYTGDVYKMSVKLERSFDDLYGFGVRIFFTNTRIELVNYDLAGASSGEMLSVAKVRSGKNSDEIVFGESVKGESKIKILKGDTVDFYLRFKSLPAAQNVNDLKIAFKEFLVAEREVVQSASAEIGAQSSTRIAANYIEDDKVVSDFEEIVDDRLLDGGAEIGGGGFGSEVLVAKGAEGLGIRFNMSFGLICLVGLLIIVLAFKLRQMFVAKGG